VPGEKELTDEPRSPPRDVAGRVVFDDLDRGEAPVGADAPDGIDELGRGEPLAHTADGLDLVVALAGDDGAPARRHAGSAQTLGETVRAERAGSIAAAVVARATSFGDADQLERLGTRFGMKGREIHRSNPIDTPEYGYAGAEM